LSRWFESLGRAYAGLVHRIDAAPRRAALIMTLVLLPALYLSGLYFMNVRAGLQDLLPADSPTVQAIKTLQERFRGGNAALILVVQSPSPEVNRRYVRTLGDALRKGNIPHLGPVQDSVATERAWARSRAPLLLPRERFDRVLREANEAIDQAKSEANPMVVTIDDDDSAEARLRRLRAEAERESNQLDRFPDGFLSSKDGKTILIRLTMLAPDTEVEPAEQLVAAVHKEVERLRPSFPANLTVHFTSDVVNILEEHSAILADVSLSSALVTVLVALLIGIYYRSTRAILAVVFGLGPGLILTFAIARLSGSTLNSNSAFLGSIIAGNGINYPLILMAYYRAQAASVPRAEAMVTAARQSVPGIAGAAATAAAAYLGLTFTSFRGFSQFGSTGSVGMITVALLTFVATPIAIAVFNPPRREQESTLAQAAVRRWYAKLGRARVVSVAVLLLLLAVGSLGLRRAMREGYWDTDIRSIRNTESVRTGSASWDKTVIEIFGTWLTPVVGMARNAEDRDKAHAALNQALVTGPHPLAERVETITRYIPPEKDQSERIEALRTLRARIEGLPTDKVPEEAQRFLDEWVPKEGMSLITAAEVPEVLRSSYTERDGEMNRTVLVFPSVAMDYNDTRYVVSFAQRIHATKLPEGTVLGGAFLVLAEIMRVLQRDAVQVMGMVCLLVALALVPIFGRKPLRIPLVVLTVTAVAVASQLIMIALGIRLNMLNFAALPITIGVGADYIVNLLASMDSLKVDAREATARMGGAILLCSLTTIVGYSTLLLASSGALRGFGQAAVLGEICAVLIVLVVYPALVRRKS
jgi:predicted RND superfamily exporter protein